jgi:hypothetical protein
VATGLFSATVHAGSLTYTGTGVTCAKIATASHELHMRPLPCESRNGLTPVITISTPDAEIILSERTILWNRKRITCQQLRTRLPSLFAAVPDAALLTSDCKPVEFKPAAKGNQDTPQNELGH